MWGDPTLEIRRLPRLAYRIAGDVDHLEALVGPEVSKAVRSALCPCLSPASFNASKVSSFGRDSTTRELGPRRGVGGPAFIASYRAGSA